MLNITHAAASAAILSAADEGRLVQGTWHGTATDGRHIACLLGSIDKSVASAADCNGALMPMWLAELTVTLFDGLPVKEILPIARRYGRLVGRWHTLSEAQWNAVLTRVLVRCIDDAVAAAQPVAEGKDYWPAVAAACEQCKAAIISGNKGAAESAKSAAESAARSAWSAAAESAKSAAESAARSAAESAWSAARSAAGSAAEAAARSAWSAAWSAATRSAAWSAATNVTCLNLFTFVLDQIELELSK